MLDGLVVDPHNLGLESQEISFRGRWGRRENTEGVWMNTTKAGPPINGVMVPPFREVLLESKSQRALTW